MLHNSLVTKSTNECVLHLVKHIFYASPESNTMLILVTLQEEMETLEKVIMKGQDQGSRKLGTCYAPDKMPVVTHAIFYKIYLFV